VPLTEVVGFTEPYLGTDAFYININDPVVIPKFVTNFTESFVDTHPYYRSNTFPARTVARTAIGSGTSTQVSGVSGSNQLRLRALTDYSFPYLTGGRYYLSTINRTATGSGVGSSITTGQRIHVRTATGSGVGSEATGASGSSQERLGKLTDYSFPYLTGGRYYLGAAVHKRTATGSGASSETATKIIGHRRTATGDGAAGESASTDLEILKRTAIGFGVGTSDADPFLFLIRQATGSGVGTSSITFKRGLLKNATGNGSATQIAARIVVGIRTATGFGVGTGTGSRKLVSIRTSTGSGAGTSSSTSLELIPRQATGSGVGAVASNATWVKSHMFRVPQTTSFAFVEAYSETTWQPRQRLFARLPNGTRTENLFELQDGSYTINDPRDGTVVRVYLGSHVIPLTDEEVADLTAAGYGAYIT